MYPSLPAGRVGLPRQSIVLLDQIRSLDGERVAGYLGSLDQRDLERIRAGVRRLLQL
ncbi:MAG TPA: type II toxin-antitoxin system PemK/MazF family toxin [Firmicutes bacterium]|nr:type II toxin-antitoxin system PemK/MazF family toxin [Candidatus Fermentithermobacillaceae bacterium]